MGNEATANDFANAQVSEGRNRILLRKKCIECANIRSSFQGGFEVVKMSNGHVREQYTYITWRSVAQNITQHGVA